MSEFPDDIMATASWVAAHRLDLSKEAGQQIVRLIAHSLNDERTKAGTRISALETATRECLSWVRHWQADVAGNLKPTPDSLAMMEAKLGSILKPVEAPEAAE